MIFNYFVINKLITTITRPISVSCSGSHKWRFKIYFPAIYIVLLVTCLKLKTNIYVHIFFFISLPLCLFSITLKDQKKKKTNPKPLTGEDKNVLILYSFKNDPSRKSDDQMKCSGNTDISLRFKSRL